MNYNDKEYVKKKILKLISLLEQLRAGVDEYKELALKIQLAYDLTGDEGLINILNNTRTAYDKAVDQYNENVVMINKHIKRYNEM